MGVSVHDFIIPNICVWNIYEVLILILNGIRLNHAPIFELNHYGIYYVTLLLFVCTRKKMKKKKGENMKSDVKKL